jgi:hypothetical protein
MSHQISEQHPQVVLRSRYVQLRALFALAAITVLCLTAAVVILAFEDDGVDSAPLTTAPAVTAPALYDTLSESPGTRYDGGPEEGTRGPGAVAPPAGTRYDGGPDEGTRGSLSNSIPWDTRYDGGPNEGTRGPGR